VSSTQPPVVREQDPDTPSDGSSLVTPPVSPASGRGPAAQDTHAPDWWDLTAAWGHKAQADATGDRRADTAIAEGGVGSGGKVVRDGPSAGASRLAHLSRWLGRLGVAAVVLWFVVALEMVGSGEGLAWAAISLAVCGLVLALAAVATGVTALYLEGKPDGSPATGPENRDGRGPAVVGVLLGLLTLAPYVVLLVSLIGE
jgi:hypothetical protein